MNILNEVISALVSEAPHPDLADTLALFGQFVGKWEFDWVGYNSDGTTDPVKGEWLFSWVLEGRAIQDVWICPHREQRGKEGIPTGEYGTSLRFYNPDKDQWQVVWFGPIIKQIAQFTARRVGDEIVLQELHPKTSQRKYIFSNITDNSFHWRSVVSDDGQKWTLSEELRALRVVRV